jgi:hypothetical protein
MALWPGLSSYCLGPGSMLLASKPRRMGSLYMYPPLYPYSDSAMAYVYLYAYARRMRGEVRPRLFSTRENRWFAEDNKNSVVDRFGRQTRGKRSQTR